MMYLFEVTNGYIGEAYSRVYVWAEGALEAQFLAEDAFREHAKGTIFGYGPSYWSDLRIRRLFADSDAPFATKPSDSGFRIEP